MFNSTMAMKMGHLMWIRLSFIRDIQEKYTKRRAEERKTAEATLESLEHNLADTIEKASQQYLDIVGSGQV